MSEIEKLIEIMKRLRDPEDGCPWDNKQDFSSIARYTLEEAYEVVDAIEREDYDDLKDELGDLLLQVVFHSQMAKEKKLFDFCDVVNSISEKMIRRHPHIFSDKTSSSVDDVRLSWEEIKKQEKALKGKSKEASYFADVDVSFPAIVRALKLQKKASEVGFDWDYYPPALDKTLEEIKELERELMNIEATSAKDEAEDKLKKSFKNMDEVKDNERRIKDEIGDVLFATINLARLLNIDPDAALRGTNNKFIERFDKVVLRLKANGSSIEDASLDEMEEQWNNIKSEEKNH